MQPNLDVVTTVNVANGETRKGNQRLNSERSLKMMDEDYKVMQQLPFTCCGTQTAGGSGWHRPLLGVSCRTFVCVCVHVVS